MHTTSILAAVSAVALSTTAFAQPSISWYTMDGGGGTSTGGSFTVSGTIGQPDASGPLTGGTFTVSGGFWAAIVSGACNPADIAGSGATYINGTTDIGADNQLSIDDFIIFLAAFSDATGCPGTAPCNPADIAGSGATYTAGTVDVGPDGDLSIDDFIIFLAAFTDATGC